MFTASPTSTTAPAVRIENVVKTYGSGDTAVTALREISLACERGQFTAVMGPSGSGKSSLLHCLAGLDSATSGRIWLGDTEITQMKDTELTLMRRRRIGFVFQSFNLLPTLTAEQNITLPLDLAGHKVDRRALRTLTDSLGISDRLSHLPAELSGGQQQRVAIARALFGGPDLIVADEPTGNLDSASGAQVLGILRAAVRERGQSVVMVTHDPAAAAYADRVVMIVDGQVASKIVAPTVEAIYAELRRVETPRVSQFNLSGLAGGDR